MTFEIFNFFPTPVFYNNIDIDIDTKEFLLNSSFERMSSGSGNFTKNHYILDNEVCKGFVDKLFFQLKLKMIHLVAHRFFLDALSKG